MKRKCSNPSCNKDFIIPKKNFDQKYCNRKCSSDHSKMKNPFIKYVCSNPNCKKIFESKPTKKSPNSRYCSKSCAAKINNKKKQKRNKETIESVSIKLSSIYFSTNISNITELHIEKFLDDMKIYRTIYNFSINKIEKLFKLSYLIYRIFYELLPEYKDIKPYKIINHKKKKLKPINKKPIKIRLCHHCNKPTLANNRKYCAEHRSLYSRNGKSLYKFTFKVENYPDLLDLTLIDKHGWYSPGGGKCSLPKNINGVSRDHKVSINDAIKNGYDPYYICHPCNCELMLHSENYKKKTNSSITYLELMKLVDDYESGRAQ